VDTFTVIAGNEHQLYTGHELEQALAEARRAQAAGTPYVVVFRDATGDRTEIGPDDDAATVRARLDPGAPARSGPGRPKLGVTSREVSLLPEHWEWLQAQRGGASATLRKLVDAARAGHQHRDAARRARDAAYKVMSVLAGDRPHFEEATRALYAGRHDEVLALAAGWPEGPRAHVGRLVERAREAQALAEREAGK